MNEKSVSLIIGVCGIAVLIAMAFPVKAWELPSDPTETGMELICLSEQPAIVEGENVTLMAWASTADGHPISGSIVFEWDVNLGRVERQTVKPRWELSAIKLEPHERRKQLTATVKAIHPDLGEMDCEVEVFIGRKEADIPDRGTIRGDNLLSAKRYLLPGEVEAPGYGLYSYLLFSSPPKDAEENARYLKTIEAYLLLLQNVEEYLRRHVRPLWLNATYIPLRSLPKPGRSNAEWAVNVLSVYDYAAAQILLRKLGQVYQHGPYLLSVLKPLSQPGMTTYLLEDLTGIVPELAWDWVKFFIYLAAQERSYVGGTKGADSVQA
jgi:hypothetical protein